jgi:hypothetical protein
VVLAFSILYGVAFAAPICRSIVTICSGLYLLIGMTSFSSKWILSHSTWYKNPRSRHQSGDRTLHSPFRSGIEIDDYQLDPVVRALSMPRVNLLIADDVGLGKTIVSGSCSGWASSLGLSARCGLSHVSAR